MSAAQSSCLQVAVLEERGHGSSAAWPSLATVGLQICTEQLHVVRKALVALALTYREVMGRMKKLNERNLQCQAWVSCLVTPS